MTDYVPSFPKEISYVPQLPKLPNDVINHSIVVAPSNGNSSGIIANTIVAFDLPASGCMDPYTLYLNYEQVLSQTTAAGNIRGTPCSAPFAKLEILFGSKVVSTIVDYNVVYNMVTNLKLNVAQKLGLPNYGWTGAAVDAMDGAVIPWSTGTVVTTYKYSFPLLSLFSNAEKLIPLFAMPNVRIQLTIDQDANYIYNASGATTVTYQNFELHFDQINFGAGVEMAMLKMAPVLSIKACDWATSAQSYSSASAGTTDLNYNLRFNSIRSLFANLAGTDASKCLNGKFDSYDVSGSNGGSYQYTIAGVQYPDRPITTNINKMGALNELKLAINGGLHDLGAANMSISVAEFAKSGNTVSSVAVPGKFWVGANVEKFCTSGSLLTGVSTKDSSMSLRIISSGTSSGQGFNVTLIALYDAIIEVNTQFKDANVAI